MPKQAVAEREETSQITDGQVDGDSPPQLDRGDVVDSVVDSAVVEPEPPITPPEPEPDEPRGKASSYVPVNRFNEVNEERKRLLQMNETLMSQITGKGPSIPQSAPFDLAAKRKEYNTALLDGDTDKATQIQVEVDNYIMEESTQRARTQANIDHENRLLADTAKAIKTDYPFLDESGEQANPEAIQMVIALRNQLVAEGKPMHNALREASARVVKFYAPSTPSVPSIDGQPSARTVAQRTANARAAANQPPAMPGVGARSEKMLDAFDVEKATEDQFRALPEAEKRKLRGD
jgi:hypothetical protein